jgi:protease-4
VRWLEEHRGITKDLKVVDWKPTPEGSWGLSGAASGALSGLPVGIAQKLIELAGQTRGIGALGLDGLVSVWHPSEN